MSLDPALIHPGVSERVDLALWERTYLDTLQALDRSLRSPAEMSAAARVLNPMLDLRAKWAEVGDEEGIARLDDIASRALEAAVGARDAMSGMAVENRLDALRMALDDGEAELAKAE